MLNTHTATRTFREAQYDVKEFLETLCSLIDCAAQGDSMMVEAEWSDGSTDIIPSVELVKDIVGNVFSSISVGSAQLKVTSQLNDNGDNVSVLKVDAPSGLQAKLGSIGGLNTHQELTGCTITEIRAERVKLEAGTSIKDFSVSLKFTSNLVTASIVEITRLSGSTCTVGAMDVRETLLDSDIYYRGSVIDASSLLSYADESTDGGVFHDKLDITGNLSITDANNNSEALGKASIIVAVPTIDTKAQGRFRTIGSDKVSGKGYVEFKPTTMVGMLLIYPKLYLYNTFINSSGNYEYEYHLGDLSVSDNNRIVTVHNTSSKTINVCNVWQYIAGNSTLVPTLKALNYVDLPPYSQVDFLFYYRDDIYGNMRTIQMLPMKHLELTLPERMVV